MRKLVSLSLLLVGSSLALFAAVPPSTPEIHASSATTAVMLLSAGVLMLGSKRSR